MFLLRKAAVTILLATSFLRPAVAQSTVATADTTPNMLLTGYFPQWGLYSKPQYLVKNLATTGNAGMLNQLNYAQGFVTGGHCSVADPNADLNYTFTAEQSVDGIADQPRQTFRGNLHQLMKLKRRFPHLKLLISLEGRSADFSQDAQPENRDAFVSSCIDIFLKGELGPGITVPGLFDGIDLDWEYPHKPDAANYLALLTAFRQRMDALRPGLLLDIAVGTSLQLYEDTDMAAVSKLVDHISLMTYDFAGPWSGTTGFVAPLRTPPAHHSGTVEDTVHDYLAAGVPASKLFMGIPFYGYGWHTVKDSNNGLFQEGQPIRGDHPYRDIQPLIQKSTLYRNDDSQAPWLFDGDAFWTYEDPISIRRKVEFTRKQHLGGLMIWELGEDTTDAFLLHAAYNAILPQAAPSIVRTAPASSLHPSAASTSPPLLR